MPKRICPFESDFFPQLKIHVREKEVNMGAMKEGNMKSVYNKTIELLFKGANVAREEKQVETIRQSIPRQSLPKRASRQMYLTNTCQLQECSEIQLQPAVPCDVCFIESGFHLKKCSFCDRGACWSCSTLCMKCNDLFCSHCFLPMYTGKEDGEVCFNCCR